MILLFWRNTHLFWIAVFFIILLSNGSKHRSFTWRIARMDQFLSKNESPQDRRNCFWFKCLSNVKYRCCCLPDYRYDPSWSVHSAILIYRYSSSSEGKLCCKRYIRVFKELQDFASRFFKEQNRKSIMFVSLLLLEYWCRKIDESETTR